MLKVWGRKTSINVQKVMWAIGELGLKYDRVDAGGTFGGLDTPEYQRLNPNRLVPVVVDDGFVLWESNAIVRHLAQKYGRGTLSPRDEQSFALGDQWMDWTQTTLYGDIISTCFLGLIRTTARDRNVAQIAAAAKRVGEKLGILDAHLKGRAYILGDSLSIADIAAGALMYRYYNLDIPRPSMANVEAWCGRIAQRPAYREHVMIDFNSLKVPGA